MKLQKNENYIAFAYSLFGSLGLNCLLNLVTIASFDERHLYPYFYPFSIITGGVCMVVCIVLFSINVNYLKSVKTTRAVILKELLIIIILFIPCFVMWDLILEYIGQAF